ncbi:hypothetical protein [Nocardioides aurantiacus]|uniref:Uncharacterized protein n=1 Tax=Nocardioides aurantiacus TaxID=86796 RepID=A0A3N2CWI4_9ACTN|nr:hypothetical protein [Nocardioides aurantiacus]ROR91778.1 hypothetical protein EDD33_2653 [Nocardioides aurantiacus]
MIQRGTLDNVTAIPAGTLLTADVAAGEAVLPVDWTAEFDEFGGLLSLNGTALAYVSADEDASTILLIDPLAASAAADDQVLSLSAAGEQRNRITAYVQIDEGEEPVPHEVPSSLEGRLTETTPSGTLVQVDTSTRIVVGVDNVEAPMDGAVVWNPYLVRRMAPAVVPTGEWYTPEAWLDEFVQMVDYTTTSATVKIPGLYDVKAAVAFVINSDDRRYIRILLNDVQVGFNAASAEASITTFVDCFATVVLEEGDVLQVQVMQGTGAGLALSTGAGRCAFSMYRVSV